MTPTQRAAMEQAIAALEGIQRYGLDTLSGRTDGPDDRGWQRAGVNEMTKRARLGIAPLRAALAEPAPVREPAKKLWLQHGVFPDVADFDADGLPRFYSKESADKFQSGQCSKPCTGKNCGSMNGWMHSIECRAEHEAVNTAPVQETSTCGRCVVFCQGGDGCLSGMSQITQIERERLVCGQLSRRTPPADVPMLTDDDLTAIYKQANGEDAGKAQPLTTQRIFKAMRAASVRQKAGMT